MRTLAARTLLVSAAVLVLASLAISSVLVRSAESPPRRVLFDGVKSEYRWTLKELNPALPKDWSDWNYLVLKTRTSTPQRFSIWLCTANGPRRRMIQSLGQNVRLRAAIPLHYFEAKEQAGFSLEFTNYRRTDSFCMSVWGPFGDLKSVPSPGVVREYPIVRPALEIRSIELSTEDPGSDFLEGKSVLDEFEQWEHADWPRTVERLAGAHSGRVAAFRKRPKTSTAGTPSSPWSD